MRVSICLLLFSTFIASLSGNITFAEEPKLQIPEGASIRLVPVKKQWFLGENILLHLEVTNNGKQAFDVDSGGDYRGGTRAGRFRVIATNEDGTVQNDPEPTQMRMGGLGGPRKIEPGETWFGNVALIRYRRLAAPGRYTIRVAHDLGWLGENFYYSSPDPKDLPDDLWAETTIDVVSPNENEARGVISDMQAMKDRGAASGEKRGLYPDYGALSYPVYVPLLLELAKSHHPEAVRGIANLVQPAGTSALIELLSVADDPEVRKFNAQQVRKQQDVYLRKDETVSEAAARALNRRLPVPTDQENSGFKHLEDRMDRAKAAWRPEHAAAVRAYATDILRNTKPSGLRDDRMEYAARLLEAIGTTEDAPAVLAAFEKTLQLSLSEPLESPLTYGLIHCLRDCVKPMKIAAVEQPKTPGEIAIYLQTWIKVEVDKQRPTEFHQWGPQWLRHPIPFVRRLTLEAMPRPIPEWTLKELTSLVGSPDVGVRHVAAKLIRESADVRFRDVLQKQMAVESDRWVIGELNEAAYATGISRVQVLRTWAQRLGDVTYDAETQRFGIGYTIFNIMQENVIENSGGGGANGHVSRADPGLVTRWLAFIEANETELSNGRKYKVGDAEITEDLFPAGVHIYLKGKPWPPK